MAEGLTLPDGWGIESYDGNIPNGVLVVPTSVTADQADAWLAANADAVKASGWVIDGVVYFASAAFMAYRLAPHVKPPRLGTSGTEGGVYMPKPGTVPPPVAVKTPPPPPVGRYDPPPSPAAPKSSIESFLAANVYWFGGVCFVLGILAGILFA